MMGVGVTFQGKKQRSSDIYIGNGAGHEVTPVFPRQESVSWGTLCTVRGAQEKETGWAVSAPGGTHVC